MATVTNGLAQINLLSTSDGGDIENVFFYWDVTNTVITDMAGIAQGFDALLMATLALPTSDTVTFENIRVRDVKGTNPDFDLAPTSLTGLVGGDVLPNFNAVRIDLIGQTKLTRRGYKRFAGVPEGSTIGNELSPAAKIAWNGVATVLNNAIVVGADTYNAIIFGKPTPMAPTRSESNLILNAITQTVLTSQITRKV